MRTSKVLTSAIACSIVLGLPQSAVAAQHSGPHQEPVAALKERDQATSLALLGVLVERRFALAQAGETDENRAARAFLDERIAGLRKRLGR